MERVWPIKERIADIVCGSIGIHKLQRAIAIVVPLIVGALSGYFAWSFSVYTIVFALVPVVFWKYANSRMSATLVFVGYYGAALSGQFVGGAVFFSLMSYPLLRATAIWSASTAVLSLIWCVFWTLKPSTYRLIAALAVTSLPPLGFVMGWASPLAGAGVLFPGAGIFGPVALLICLHTFQRRSDLHLLSRPVFYSVVLATLFNLSYSFPVAENVSGVNTSFGRDDVDLNHVGVLRRINHWQIPAENRPGTIYLFPELIADDWSVDRRYLEDLDRRLSDRGDTALIGSRVFDGTNTYLNTLMAIGKPPAHSSMLSAVIPAPIAHWRPWSLDTAKRGEWGQELNIEGKKLRTLICYEQTLFWYVFSVFATKPDVVLAPANIWWATSSNIPVAQKNTVESVARLFGIPVVFAFNQ